LRARVASSGKFSLAELPESGRPILYDEEEWLRRRARLDSRYYIVTTLTLVPVLLALAYLSPLQDLDTLMALSRYLCLYGLVLGVIALRESLSHRGDIKRGTYTALFEGGLQVRYMVDPVPWFIPYSEIESVQRGRWFYFEHLFVKLRGRRRRWRGQFALEVLGDEGYELLERLARGEAPPPQVASPPRLVLYDG
jgi:hypothetical protein